MGKKPLALRIDEGLLERVDAARGDVPRTRWVERALESALSKPVHAADQIAAAERVVRERVEKMKRAPETCSACGAVHDLGGVQHVSGCALASPKPSVPRSKPVPRVPGVQTAAELMAERQARLNKAKGS